MKLPPYAEALLMLLGAIVVIGFVAVVYWPAAGMLAGAGIFAAGYVPGSSIRGRTIHHPATGARVR